MTIRTITIRMMTIRMMRPPSVVVLPWVMAAGEGDSSGKRKQYDRQRLFHDMLLRS